MLTLTGQLEIAKCNLYRDEFDPLTWYIMPQSPRIALDETGKPIFSLVWYRREVSELTEEERRTRLGGGILTLSAELSPTEEQMQEIRRQLSQDPALHKRLNIPKSNTINLRNWWQNEINRDPKKLAEALKINTVPVTEGSVTISVLAETPETGTTGDFVTSLVGAGRVSMTGRQRASFMAKLTQEGAVLLWNMLEQNLPAIRIAYELKFSHRLDAVKMEVWCNAKKTYDAIQDQWQKLQDNASFSERHSGRSSTYSYSHDEVKNARNDISEIAKASETVRITITQGAATDSGAVSQEQITELTRIGNDMVRDFLASTFLEFKAGADVTFDEKPDLQTELPKYSGGSGGEREYGHHGVEYYNLNTWHESMNANLSYRFNSQAVLSSYLGPNDNLANILTGHSVEDFRTQVDLEADWYNYLDVEVICTADFANEPVDLVRTHLVYNANGPGGSINSAGDFVFNKDRGSQHFSTYLAAPDKRNYDYECEVFYKGTSDTYKFEDKSSNEILVLDTDTLGILNVNIQVGEVNWEKIRNVLAKMWYGSGTTRKEVEFSLTSEKQSYHWLEAIAKTVTDPYHYQLTFVDVDGQHIKLEEENSRSKTLVITQPLHDEMEITILPSGNYAPEGLISHIVVSLRYKDETNNYNVEETFTLSGPRESANWKVPLIDTENRTFEYMEKTIYSDGVNREMPWRSTSDTILTVGDKFDFRLQITPNLLQNRNFMFGTIFLKFSDSEHNIHMEKTLQINDFTQPLFWRFRLGDPDSHTYKYQLTLFKNDGTEVNLPEADNDREVLVLRPPA